MTATQTDQFCTNCGKPVLAKFCGACGAPVSAAEQDQHGWRGVAEDLLAEAKSNALPSVTWQFATAPIATALRLTEDPTYREHWRFMFAGLAVNFALFSVFLPRLLALAGANLPTSSGWDALVQQGVFVLAVLIMAPPLYFLMRWLSGLPRTPRAYLKLAALGFGYWSLLATVIGLVLMAAMVALVFAAHSASLGPAIEPYAPVAFAASWAAYQASVVWVFAALNRAFWRLSWLVCGLVALAYVVVSQWLVFPTLWAVVEELDVADWLSRLFG